MKDLLGMDRLDYFESTNLLSLRFNVFCEPEPHEYLTPPIPFIRFVYIQKGTVSFVVDGAEAMRGCPGNLIYIPAKLGYRSVWPEASQLFVADLYVDDFADSGLDYGDEIRVLYTDRRGTLKESIDKLGKNRNAEQPYLWMERASIVMHILCEISRAQEAESALQSRINQSVVYLKYNFEKDTSVEELAKMCAFSVSQFRRLFGQYFNMSPVEYRNRLRVRHAADLIRNRNVTVARAAEMVGMENASYFIRLYKKYTGETPGKSKGPAMLQNGERDADKA